MEIVVGMILAFLLGAYVRKPFEIRRAVEVQEKIPSKDDEELMQLYEEEARKEAQRQIQMYNIMNWNGEKGTKLRDGD